jgi:hypothetical protein
MTAYWTAQRTTQHASTVKPVASAASAFEW